LVLDGFYPFKYLLGLLIHFLEQFLVLPTLQLVKFPFAIIPLNSLHTLQLGLDLTVNSVDIDLHQLELHLLLVHSIFCVLVKYVQRFLADWIFEVVPIIILHEIDKILMLEDVGKLTEQHLQDDIAAPTL
jgi:hypothetical protein